VAVECLYIVPQESSLGTIFFLLYTALVADVFKSLNVQHAHYADDTQIYIALEGVISLLLLSNCFNAVHQWFTLNGLSLHPDKSYAIVVGIGARQRLEGKISTILLDGVAINQFQKSPEPYMSPCLLIVTSTISAGYLTYLSVMFVRFTALENCYLLLTLRQLPLQ
jgi:hypothetical protein